MDKLYTVNFSLSAGRKVSATVLATNFDAAESQAKSDLSLPNNTQVYSSYQHVTHSTGRKLWRQGIYT